MIRTHAIRSHAIGPAVAVVLAVLLALRCGLGWAGPSPEADRLSAAAAGKSLAAVAAPARLVPARCEAIGDDPHSAAPGACPNAVAGWARPRALPARRSDLSNPGAPAPPPPARGPPAPATPA